LNALFEYDGIGQGAGNRKAEECTMNEAMKQILAASLQLNDRDRRELADAIADTLEIVDCDLENSISPEFRTELNRRRQELKNSPEIAVSAEEGLRRMTAIRPSR